MTAPYGVLVEIDLAGVWEDITEHVRIGAGIAITRGRGDEQAAQAPCRVNLSLNNAAGRFSPRNPVGPYYGLIGRNTVLRITVTGMGTDDSVRFVGEVAAWPVSWEPAEADCWVSISAAGIRRRLSQGQTPLRTPLYRSSVAVPGLAAYWPMHDPVGALNFASAEPGVPALTITGPVTFVANSTAFPAVDPLPTFGGATAIAPLPASSTGVVQVRALLFVPSGISSAIQSVITVRCAGGTIGTLELALLPTTGEMAWQAFAPDGTFIVGATAGLTTDIRDRPVRVSVTADQNGANVDLDLDLRFADGSTANYPVTVNSRTLGTPTSVGLGDSSNIPGAGTSRTGLTSVSAGELLVQTQVTSVTDLNSAIDGYAGELADDRINRLCTEEGISLVAGGTSLGGVGTPLGIQRAGTLLSLIDEAAAADGGILAEQINALGFSYTPRVDLYNQLPTLTLDYAAKQLADLAPVEDDQRTVNDFTATRIGGASARYALEDGPLSVQAPPDGVSRYDSSASLSLASDAQLEDQAAWRVHLGTVDEPRYPGIAFDLARATDPFSSGDQDDVFALIEGRAVQVDNPPAFAGAPDDVRQLLAGWREDIGSHVYRFTMVCIPASPYDVGVYDDEGDGTYQGLRLEPGTRYSPDITVTNEALDSTETAIDITTDPDWTTSGAQYPLDIFIGGERITVAGCTGSGGTQTFTGCTRSVNGVVKGHDIGTEVRLWQPAVYAL